MTDSLDAALRTYYNCGESLDEQRGGLATVALSRSHPKRRQKGLV